MIFTSYSGDKFIIPDKQYEAEKAIYNEAISQMQEYASEIASIAGYHG